MPGSEAVHVLAPLPSLSFTVLSVKWSTFYKQYLAVGQGMYNRTSAYIFAKSDDLLNWGPPQLIRYRLENSPGPGETFVSENYASIIDPTSVDPNFNTVKV